MLRPIVFLLAVVGLATIAGCGGGSDVGGGQRLSMEEWIAQADAICAQANEEIDALGEPESVDEFAAFVGTAIEVGERQLADLKDLRPPEEAEADYARALEVVEGQLAIARRIEEAVVEEDFDRVQELVEEGDALDEEGDAIADKYGLQECGQG